MKTIFDKKFNTYIVVVGQGEYATTSKPEILSTILGSCVSVCLLDTYNKVAGMNHYLLPEPVLVQGNINFEKAKYGINAIEMMINDMLKLGAKKNDIKAKVFGGANMFNFAYEGAHVSVGKQNVDFAYRYLEIEKISIISNDVLGNSARKIYFDTNSGEVRLFRLGDDDSKNVKKIEADYSETIKKLNKESTDDINKIDGTKKQTDNITIF